MNLLFRCPLCSVLSSMWIIPTNIKICSSNFYLKNKNLFTPICNCPTSFHLYSKIPRKCSLYTQSLLPRVPTGNRFLSSLVCWTWSYLSSQQPPICQIQTSVPCLLLILSIVSNICPFHSSLELCFQTANFGLLVIKITEF